MPKITIKSSRKNGIITKQLRSNYLLLAALAKCKPSICNSILSSASFELSGLIREVCLFLSRDSTIKFSRSEKAKLIRRNIVLTKLRSASPRLCVKIVRKEGIYFFRQLLSIAEVYLEPKIYYTSSNSIERNFDKIQKSDNRRNLKEEEEEEEEGVFGESEFRSPSPNSSEIVNPLGYDER